MSYRIVIVDDEPDVHILTRMSLKKMRFNDQDLELVFYDNGRDSVKDLEEHPETALILMDVVMESDSAGLDAVRVIREELGNEMVRIFLRTGQPGSAPEKKVIETYDIDGYLSKADLTQTRLFSAVRTGLKSYSELLLLQQYRDSLTYLNMALLNLHATNSRTECLEELTQIVSALAGSELTILYLLPSEPEDAVPHVFFNGPEEMDDDTLHLKTLAILDKIKENPERLRQPAGTFSDGWLTPITVPQNQGYGMIYVHLSQPNDLQLLMLEMLASHVGVALSFLPEQPNSDLSASNIKALQL